MPNEMDIKDGDPGIPAAETADEWYEGRNRKHKEETESLDDFYPVVFKINKGFYPLGGVAVIRVAPEELPEDVSPEEGSAMLVLPLGDSMQMEEALGFLQYGDTIIRDSIQDEQAQARMQKQMMIRAAQEEAQRRGLVVPQ